MKPRDELVKGELLGGSNIANGMRLQGNTNLKSE